MLRLSIITTILEPDSGLVKSVGSVRLRPNCEHLVSIAGNAERTSLILEGAGVSHVIPIAAPGASIAEGFNACLQRASGDLVWVLNSGDEELDIDPVIHRFEQNKDLDFAYGDVKYGDKIVQARPSPLTPMSCLLHGMGFCHGGVIVRRSFHERFWLYIASYK